MSRPKKIKQLYGLAKSSGYLREHWRIGWFEPQLNSLAKLSNSYSRSTAQSKCIDIMNLFRT